MKLGIEAEKHGEHPVPIAVDGAPQTRSGWKRTLALFLGVGVLLWWNLPWSGHRPGHRHCPKHPSPYGQFPKRDDPFQFIPCTSQSQLPSLNDSNVRKTWARTFNPNPADWSWGSPSEGKSHSHDRQHHQHHQHRPDHGHHDHHGHHGRHGHHDHHDPYAGRGIYLCGYLDVPLDYTNPSDSRIARLAVTKYQVSGLAPVGRHRPRHHEHHHHGSRGTKSLRTIVVEPGGPGGSGQSYAWGKAEAISERFSSGKFDVLGWDPRGVNASLPRASCFPFDADRDRWSLLREQYRIANTTSPSGQLLLADTMNEAMFSACKETLGDLGRFISTAFVARDVDQILTALNEPELTGYFVSYGTGIGQTFANMFPKRVGRLILDGTEYVRDHRLVGGFGWTALDNATNAWNDGFLGECVDAGSEHCALAQPLQGDSDSDKVTLVDLQDRMSALFSSLAARPLPAYVPSSGPSIVTYSQVVGMVYQAMYNAESWPALAKALLQLEQGNSTLVARMLDRSGWEFEPPGVCSRTSPGKPSTDELGSLVICADTYDAPKPWLSQTGEDDEENDLEWWAHLWHNMTNLNWIAGDSRFYDVLPCRHYKKYFGSAAEIYRGDLNHTLSHPVLLIAETYDPATPLRNGRRLLHEMGDNARLIVHHGYGHSSRDTSNCTDSIGRAYILEGTVPEESETDCYANGKPYRYASSATAMDTEVVSGDERDLEIWRKHVRELRLEHPGRFH